MVLDGNDAPICVAVRSPRAGQGGLDANGRAARWTRSGPHRRGTRAAKIRHSWQLLEGGMGIHWDEIDEDLRAAGLLRDAPA